jgi:ubiquinone/menaquinone biosynthesis C-methylase UbiE
MGISFAAFPHFEDKAAAVREAGRVLKRGASFFIIHLASSEELAAMHNRAGGAVASDMLPPEKELRRMFADAYFKEVQIEDRPGLYLASGVNAK